MTTVIRDNKTLREAYHFLRRGDIVLGRVSLQPTEEHLLADLMARGIHLIPSALSQLASRSKVLQSQLFTSWLPPRTLAIHDNHQLLNALSRFSPDEKVITKQDRKNAGMGIHLWGSAEEVYTHATLGNLPYPFVLQPFFQHSKDIRVVVLDDYVEAYWRKNSHNFRNNLHCGGESTPCRLTPEQELLCREVMLRGMFPYAHVDIMVTEVGESFLLEINLRGGIRGAGIDAAEYSERVTAIHKKLLKQL